VQSLDSHAPVSIRRRELLLHSGGEAMHFVPALIQCDLRAQPSDHAERAVAAALRGIHRQRDEDLGCSGRADLCASNLPKRGQHNADDAMGRPVQDDRTADDRPISAKRAHPE
jgi:hypothetical protein